MSEEAKPECPCSDAHRRLQDVHEHLHRSMESYLEPEDFRMEVNSFLSHARSVSFLIQKRKASLQNFDEWYLPWRETCKQNPIMNWAVEARNRVVKEEDLETLSSMRLTFYGPRLAEMSEDLQVPPSLETAVAAQQLGSYLVSKGVPRPAWVRVERKWIDQELPAHEICGAFREVLSRLTGLVRLAHQANGVDACNLPTRKRECVTAELPWHFECLGLGNPLGSVLVNARTGETTTEGFQLERHEQTLTSAERERIANTFKLADLPPRLRDQPEGRLEMLRQFMEMDGGILQMLLLEGVHDEVRHFRMQFDDSRPREERFDQVVEAQGGWEFHTALMVSEAWLYPPGGLASVIDLGESEPIDAKSDLYDGPRFRGAVEAITVDMVDRDGLAVALVQPFVRTNQGVIFGTAEKREGMASALPMLRPLWRSWPAWKDWKLPRMGPPPKMDGSSFRRRPGSH